MKIFNFGSDYAYQQKKKSQETAPKIEVTKEEKPITPHTNEEDKIQNGGGREMEISPEKAETPDPQSDSETESQQGTETPEKKKRSAKKQEQETD